MQISFPFPLLLTKTIDKILNMCFFYENKNRRTYLFNVRERNVIDINKMQILCRFYDILNPQSLANENTYLYEVQSQNSNSFKNMFRMKL